jgi:pro-sigmaK processing inhibitor BofA
MIKTILLILFAIAVAAVIYYFLKKATSLLINAIIGLVALFIVNQLDIFGMGDVPINWLTVIVCAFGGLPGAILLIILNMINLL